MPHPSCEYVKAFETTLRIRLSRATPFSTALDRRGRRHDDEIIEADTPPSLKNCGSRRSTLAPETVYEKPFFRGAVKHNRCLIPVSGYYESQDTLGGKQPYYFTARDGSPALTIEGLWDECRDKVSGETLRSCTMIITEPNEFVAAIRDRMPVLLTEKDYEPWLRGRAGLELLKPVLEDLLQCWPVSKRVNSSRAGR